jgi:L-tartrate/succinate antiporter
MLDASGRLWGAVISGMSGRIEPGRTMKPWLRYAAPLGVGLALAFGPSPTALPPGAWRYLALFVAVVVALVLEPLPAPAVGLVGIASAAALRLVAPEPEAALRWALGGFADRTVWLIFGAFTFSLGYEKTGLGRRIALTLVKRLGGSTLGLGYAALLADLLIAPFTPSNTARSAGIVYPILRGIPALYGSEPGPSARKIGAYLMWTAFATTAVTSSLFLTALSPNLMAVSLIRRATALDISWARWSLGFLPVGVALLVPLPLLVYAIYPPEIRSSREVPAWAADELRKMGGPSAKEWAMGLLILVAFLLWVFDRDRIDPTTVALVAVSLMLVGGLLRWEDLAGNREVWGILVYFATLLTLADGLQRVGVVSWAAGLIAGRLSGASPPVVVALLVSFFFLVHYLFASLTAHTTAVLPVLLATGLAIPGVPIAMFAMLAAYAIGLMGVLTPYATGPAPVYFGSGFIPRKDFWLLGAIFGAIYLIALLAIGIPYLWFVTVQ